MYDVICCYLLFLVDHVEKKYRLAWSVQERLKEKQQVSGKEILFALEKNGGFLGRKNGAYQRAERQKDRRTERWKDR